jgi:hypothetical protein
MTGSSLSQMVKTTTNTKKLPRLNSEIKTIVTKRWKWQNTNRSNANESGDLIIVLKNKI